jgi:hypothetical protein
MKNIKWLIEALEHAHQNWGWTYQTTHQILQLPSTRLKTWLVSMLSSTSSPKKRPKGILVFSSIKIQPTNVPRHPNFSNQGSHLSCSSTHSSRTKTSRKKYHLKMKSLLVVVPNWSLLALKSFRFLKMIRKWLISSSERLCALKMGCARRKTSCYSFKSKEVEMDPILDQ